MTVERFLGFNRNLTLDSAERQRSVILVVESTPGDKQSMRQTLSALGFTNISDANDHLGALKKLEERPVTHIIFDAKKTNMPVKEFLTKALEYDDKIVAIPTSYDPTIDDVFDLLVIGARGYIVKPLTTESVDSALTMATKGERLSDAILYAKDRNEALTSLVMTALDRLATIKRQSTHFETAKREVPRAGAYFARAIDIAHTFAKGGHVALLESIIEFCIERGSGPATKLGRVRKRLEKKKAVAQDAEAAEQAVVK